MVTSMHEKTCLEGSKRLQKPFLPIMIFLHLDLLEGKFFVSNIFKECIEKRKNILAGITIYSPVE